MKKFLKGMMIAMAMTVMLPASVFAKEDSILSGSSTKLLSQKDVKKLSDWELRAGRCEITARHGKEVYSEDLKLYFEGTDWYAPSDEYDSSCLSETEKENIQTLYTEELSRKQKAATEQFEENQRISASGDVQVMSSSFVYMDSPYTYDDLVGTWVCEKNPTYPIILEISEKNGSFYYEYYAISPGNEIGAGFTKTYTTWYNESGLLEMNCDNGFITCYSGDTSDSAIVYNIVYDVMSDSFVEASTDQYRDTFEKNDDYSYELPKDFSDL